MEAILDPQQVARNQPPSRGDGGLLGEAPALSDPGWLPESTSIAELDELREEHQRLHEAAVEIGRALAEVERRHEQEDAAYEGALRAQAAGQSGVKVPEVTPPDERAAELSPLKAKARASAEVRESFAVRAVATISERYDEWVSELQEADREAEFQARRRGGRSPRPKPPSARPCDCAVGSNVPPVATRVSATSPDVTSATPAYPPRPSRPNSRRSRRTPRTERKAHDPTQHERPRKGARPSGPRREDPRFDALRVRANVGCKPRRDPQALDGQGRRGRPDARPARSRGSSRNRRGGR